MSVIVERTDDSQFPIDVGLSDGWHHLTEKAAVELRDGLNEVIALQSSTLDAVCWAQERAKKVLSMLDVLFPGMSKGPKERCPICCEPDLDCAVCMVESVAQHFAEFAPNAGMSGPNGQE